MEKGASDSKPSELTSKFLPANMERLTPEIIQKAREELGEIPESREEGLKELKRLIKTEKDFQPLMDETFLLRFLRTRKFNAQAAFQMIKNFYLSTDSYNRVLTNFWPSEVKHVFDLHTNIMMVLPYRDRAGCIVGVGSLEPIDFTKISMIDIVKAIGVYIEYVLLSEATQICGAVLVLNLKGVTFQQMRHFFSLKLLIPAITMFKNCIPVRLKAMHFIYEPHFFNVFFSSMKKVIPGKIIKRFHFHGQDIDSLHTHVPPEILPEEFGGRQGPIDSTSVVKEILAIEDHFTRVLPFGFKKKQSAVK